ncbi:MAG: KH domain-containing protein [bacterium]|nr:KH domain-containing protein [bacterium]
MKTTLEYILTHLVDHPESLAVTETKDDTRSVYSIHADPLDCGKIIGKQGRIIRAIRDCIKMMATKRNEYVDVVLEEQPKDQS